MAKGCNPSHQQFASVSTRHPYSAQGDVCLGELPEKVTPAMGRKQLDMVWGTVGVVVLGRLYQLAFGLGSNAVMGWMDDQIAQHFGITSPTLLQAASILLEWGPPIVVTILLISLFHWWRDSKKEGVVLATPQPSAPLDVASTVEIAEGAPLAGSTTITRPDPPQPNQQKKPPIVISVQTLIIVGMCLATGAYLYFSTNTKPQPSLPPARAEPPKTAEAKPLPPREFVDNFDYPSLAKRLESLNGLQAQQVQAIYIGKWVRVTGQLKSLREYSPSGAIAALIVIPGSLDRAYLSLSFAGNWRSRLSFLSNGDTITATCRIYEFWTESLALDSCELP